MVYPAWRQLLLVLVYLFSTDIVKNQANQESCVFWHELAPSSSGVDSGATGTWVTAPSQTVHLLPGAQLLKAKLLGSSTTDGTTASWSTPPQEMSQYPSLDRWQGEGGKSCCNRNCTTITCHTPKHVRQNAIKELTMLFGSLFDARNVSDWMGIFYSQSGFFE